MLRGLPSLACPIASLLSSSSGQLSNEIFNPPPQTFLGINAFEFWLFALRDLRSLHTLSPQIPAACHARSTSSMQLTPSSNRRRHHNTTPPPFSVRVHLVTVTSTVTGIHSVPLLRRKSAAPDGTVDISGHSERFSPIPSQAMQEQYGITVPTAYLLCTSRLTVTSPPPQNNLPTFQQSNFTLERFPHVEPTKGRIPKNRPTCKPNTSQLALLGRQPPLLSPT
jgi:hypothetical protein